MAAGRGRAEKLSLGAAADPGPVGKPLEDIPYIPDERMDIDPLADPPAVVKDDARGATPPKVDPCLAVAEGSLDACAGSTPLCSWQKRMPEEQVWGWIKKDID